MLAAALPESSELIAASDDLPTLISRHGAQIDVELISTCLQIKGYAVLDNILGQPAMASIRDGISGLDRAGELKPGKIQHGLQQTTESASRSDCIAFLQQETCDDAALTAYIQLADDLRARLSSDERLIDHVQGTLDGGNYMCAIYPGGGSCYVKHRDALPYRAGRKLTVPCHAIPSRPLPFSPIGPTQLNPTQSILPYPTIPGNLLHESRMGARAWRRAAAVA